MIKKISKEIEEVKMEINYKKIKLFKNISNQAIIRNLKIKSNNLKNNDD